MRNIKVSGQINFKNKQSKTRLRREITSLQTMKVRQRNILNKKIKYVTEQESQLKVKKMIQYKNIIKQCKKICGKNLELGLKEK